MADTYETYRRPEPAQRRPEHGRRDPGSHGGRVERSDRAAMAWHGGCGGGGAVQRFMLVSMVCIAIWAMTGAGYFWPMWVLLGTGIPAVMAVLGRTRVGRW
jgi:hypothetical protein